MRSYISHCGGVGFFGSTAHPAPLIGLIAELLNEGAPRESQPGLDPDFAALTVTAGTMFPAVQAAAVGAEPAISIGPALNLLWLGIG